MILKGLKRNAIKKQTEAYLLKRRSSSQGVSGLKTLAILIDASQSVNMPVLVKIANELGVKSEKLIVMGFKDEKDIDENDLEIKYYSDKSFGVRGDIKDSSLKSFVEKDYDVLISFYDEDKIELNYISSASRAKLKVGFAEVDHRINDLIIGSATNNVNLFMTELKKYLKILQII